MLHKVCTFYLRLKLSLQLFCKTFLGKIKQYQCRCTLDSKLSLTLVPRRMIEKVMLGAIERLLKNNAIISHSQRVFFKSKASLSRYKTIKKT